MQMLGEEGKGAPPKARCGEEGRPSSCLAAAAVTLAPGGWAGGCPEEQGADGEPSGPE